MLARGIDLNSPYFIEEREEWKSLTEDKKKPVLIYDNQHRLKEKEGNVPKKRAMPGLFSHAEYPMA